MPWVPAAIGLGGGLLMGASQRSAASTAADAQIRAAQMAAEASKFRPVGVTTRFGQSTFQTSPEGYVTGAGYTVSPELKAYQDRLMALAGQGLTTAEQAQGAYQPLRGAAQGLFNLGQQYLAQTPEEVAQKYMASQQALLQPGREKEMADIQNRLFQTGRGGLAVSQGGALGAANPELQAYYNAKAQQDAALAAQAQQAGQQQLAFGTGLFGTGAGLLGTATQGATQAIAPFTTYLGGASSVEELGQQQLTLGAGLGGQQAAYGAQVGRNLLTGGLSAAQTMQNAQFDPLAYGLMGIGRNPSLSNAFGNWMNPNMPYGTQGVGGGITSMGMFSPTQTFSGETIPMGYANL